MSRTLRAFNLLCAAAMIGVASVWLSQAAPRVPAGRMERASDSTRAPVRVLEVEPAVVDPQLQVMDRTGSDRRREEGVMKTRVVGVEVLTGPYAGHRLALTLLVHPNPASTIPLAKGDVVRGNIVERDGKPDEILLSRPILRCRQVPLIIGFFLIALLLVGGTRGVRLVVAIVCVGFGTFGLYLPALCRGLPALPVTIGFSLLAVVVTFLLTDRLSRKTLSAFVGVVVPLAIAGLLAAFFVDELGFTGRQTTSAVILSEYSGQGVDLRGLLAASMVVVVLGIAIDMAISLASAVDVLYEARPDLPPWEAFSSGMVVSRDVTGTELGTMFFAYMGARLPVLFFPGVAGISAAETLNSEPGSIELTRLLIAAIGLLLTGPVSVAASVAFNTLLPRKPVPKPVGPTRTRRSIKLWVIAGLEIVGLIALVTSYARWHGRIDDALAAARAKRTIQQQIDATADPAEALDMAYDLSTRGEYDAATCAAWRARELAPRSAESHICVGYVYAHRRWQPNALHEFERALEFDPDNVTALYYAGHVHFNLRQYQKAVRHLTKAASLSPESVDVLYELAVALTHMREWHLAEHYALKAYYLDPEDARLSKLIECIGVDEKILERIEKDVEAKKRKNAPKGEKP